MWSQFRGSAELPALRVMWCFTRKKKQLWPWGHLDCKARQFAQDHMMNEYPMLGLKPYLLVPSPVLFTLDGGPLPPIHHGPWGKGKWKVGGCSPHKGNSSQ